MTSSTRAHRAHASVQTSVAGDGQRQSASCPPLEVGPHSGVHSEMKGTRYCHALRLCGGWRPYAE